MSYASIDGLEIEAQLAHIEDSLRIQQLQRVANTNATGRCLECDEVIPAARLRVVPDANYCIECQTERDGDRAVILTHRNPYVP